MRVNEPIYPAHNGTTPVDRRVLEAELTLAIKKLGQAVLSPLVRES